MNNTTQVWKPGSFTKNFSWGTNGLSQLHNFIRVGFDNQLTDVPRELFRERVRSIGRSDYIAVNFFLFNKTVGNISYICADELVFQALNWEHSAEFDKLALFGFILSLAGVWKGARPEQRYPALWAKAYIEDIVSGKFDWNTEQVNANNIENFIKQDKRYQAETTRKVSTNLAYIFKAGRLNEFPTTRIERWWINSLFLALDRIIADREINNIKTLSSQYLGLLNKNNFLESTGKSSLEKKLALKHIISLYEVCGSRSRFSEEKIIERTEILCPDQQFNKPNDPRPRGAIHKTNPRILKGIPALCTMLAKYAGFDVISYDQMEESDFQSYINEKTSEALAQLREKNIKPTMSAEEIMRLTRDR